MIAATTPLIAYLLGSIPCGYLIVRWQKGIDVRSTGSGGTGATNVMRNLGIIGFIATFILDVGKGILAVLLTSRLTSNDPRWIAAASFAAILGHCFPVWLKFRGGKGVATALGVFAALSVASTLAAVVIFVLALILWRYVSLASVSAAASMPLLIYFLWAPGHAPPLVINLGTLFATALIFFKHRANLQRLTQGTEPKYSLKKSKGDQE